MKTDLLVEVNEGFRRNSHLVEVGNESSLCRSQLHSFRFSWLRKPPSHSCVTQDLSSWEAEIWETVIIFIGCLDARAHFTQQCPFYGFLHSNCNNRKQNNKVVGLDNAEIQLFVLTTIRREMCVTNSITWLLHWIVMNCTVHSWL